MIIPGRMSGLAVTLPSLSMTSSICGLAHDPTRKLTSGNSLDRPGIGKLIALTAHTGHHFLTLSQYKAGVT